MSFLTNEDIEKLIAPILKLKDADVIAPTLRTILLERRRLHDVAMAWKGRAENAVRDIGSLRQRLEEAQKSVVNFDEALLTQISTLRNQLSQQSADLETAAVQIRKNEIVVDGFREALATAESSLAEKSELLEQAMSAISEATIRERDLTLRLQQQIGNNALMDRALGKLRLDLQAANDEVAKLQAAIGDASLRIIDDSKRIEALTADLQRSAKALEQVTRERDLYRSAVDSANEALDRANTKHKGLLGHIKVLMMARRKDRELAATLALENAELRNKASSTPANELQSTAVDNSLIVRRNAELLAELGEMRESMAKVKSPSEALQRTLDHRDTVLDRQRNEMRRASRILAEVLPHQLKTSLTGEPDDLLIVAQLIREALHATQEKAPNFTSRDVESGTVVSITG